MPQIRVPQPPSLPVATPAYDRMASDNLLRVLRLYFAQQTTALQQLLLGFNTYGTFSDTTTQTNPVANAENLMTFDTTVEAFGIAVDSGVTSRVVVSRPGVYNIQFSAQLDATGGGTTTFHIWFKKNGTNIDNSASRVVLGGPNDEKVAAWNYLLTLNSGDYFEIAWSSPTTSAVLRAEAAAAPVPAVPSVILTAVYVYPDAAGQSP